MGYYCWNQHNPKKTMDKKNSKSNSNGVIGETTEADNVDKIRDILFGNQMRDVDKRFASLEKSLTNDLAAMRNENALQIESLKTYIESEIEILGAKLSGEEKSRIDDVDELDGNIKQQAKQIDKKVADVIKSLDKTSRDTNQKILKQTQDFSNELTKQISETRDRMDDQREALSVAKVDKQVLSEVLNALALQINPGDSDK